MHETIHLTLSQDPSLSMADRYRHLAAHHILQNELKKGCQALWASHTDLKKFLPLENVKKILANKPLPEWLEKPAWGARFPACLNGATVGQQEWAEHHHHLAKMAINMWAGRLHVIVMNIFFGFYGFAVQSMLNLEGRCDDLLPQDIEDAWAMVEAMPPPPLPFYQNLWE